MMSGAVPSEPISWALIWPLVFRVPLGPKTEGGGAVSLLGKRNSPLLNGPDAQPPKNTIITAKEYSQPR